MTTPEELWRSAERLGLATLEHRIASWIRQYSTADPSAWVEAENTLLQILLNFATIPPSNLMPPDGESDAVANALARALGNCERHADYSTAYLVTLSALAFAAAGNFPSAAVFADKVGRSPEVSQLEKWVTEFLTDGHLNLQRESTPIEFGAYARATIAALRSGEHEQFRIAEELLEKACQESLDRLDNADRYLLLFLRQIHARIESLSAARILRQLHFPNPAYVAELVSSWPLLYPSQADTLLKYPLLHPGAPVLITLPTGTGKSLLGELALVASLTWNPGDRWLAVYLAPYRALTDQLQRRMVSRLKRVGIKCVIRRGGYLDVKPFESGIPTVLVATPEAFDFVLRQRDDLYHHISGCVFDEFHLIEQHERGLRYEGLIGRLLSASTGDAHPKIVGLSAVVQDTKLVEEWLGIDSSHVAKSGWRPTGRRLSILDRQGEINYFTPGEQLPGTRGGGEIAWQGHVDMPNPGLDLPTRNWSSVRDTYSAEVNDNLAGIAVDQWMRFRAPILVICKSRAQTRQVASAIARSWPEPQPNPDGSFLAREIALRYPYLITLQRCLAQGIIYHNASLPDWVRGQLERLIDQGGARVVAATTTLAEGVDLPFRVVVLADWRQWQFGRSQPIPTLLFRNLAGRSGRAWRFAEGDTIIVDQPDSEVKTDQQRYRQYITLYVNPGPYALKSSVARSLDSKNEQIIARTRAVLESQFLAHVASSPPSDAIEQEFVTSVYAGRVPKTAHYALNTMREFIETSLARPELRVMERQSPLRLTEFGDVVLRTGLSPRTGVALARLLSSYQPQSEPSNGARQRSRFGIAWEPVIAWFWDHLSWSSELIELEGTKTDLQRRGYAVNEASFPLMVMAWLSGLPVEVIAYLTFRGDRAKRKHIEDWLNNTTDELFPDFEGDIEQVGVLCGQYLGEQWAWMFRGASAIASHSNKEELASELAQLAVRLQFGVKSLGTAKLLRTRTCPLDRSKLDWFVQSYNPLRLNTDSLDLQQFARWLNDFRPGPTARLTPFARTNITTRDVDELRNFIASMLEEQQDGSPNQNS